MSALCSREARWAIWRSCDSVAAVVAWVEGELVARRTLPGAGWEDILGCLWRKEWGVGDFAVQGLITVVAGWRKRFKSMLDVDKKGVVR